MTKSNDKNSIKILYELLKKYSNKEEIIEKYSIKSGAFFKHLTEIKQAGFEIFKDGANYKIKTFSNLYNLTNHETSMIANILVLSYFISSKKRTKNLLKTLNKILLLSSKENYDEIFKKFELFKKSKNNIDYSNKITAFEEFIDKNKITKVTTTQQKTYILKPKEIKTNENKIYFHFYDEEKDENKTIAIEDITKIIPIDESESNILNEKEIIFELSGRLAKIYRLRENERLVDKFPDKIIIANSNSDKTVLFKRLLRYDILCRVLFPENDVNEFKNLIANSLRKLKNGI